MKNLIASFVLATSTLVSAGASAQEYSAFEGKNAIQEGEGGTKKLIDGLEFWADGAPPKKFKLLGFITDRRHKSGIFGAISMSSLESNVAKLAKENGGDAVILVSAASETVGTVSQGSAIGQGTSTTSGSTTAFRGSAWGTGTTAAVQKQNSKYAVVKFVSADAGTAPTLQPVDEAAKQPATQP